METQGKVPARGAGGDAASQHFEHQVRCSRGTIRAAKGIRMKATVWWVWGGDGTKSKTIILCP